MCDGNCSATTIGDGKGEIKGDEQRQWPVQDRSKGLLHRATRIPTLQESGAGFYPPTLLGLEDINRGAHVTDSEEGWR